MKKRLLLCLLTAVFLSSCGSNETTSSSGNDSKKEEDTPVVTELTHNLQLTNSDIFQHIDYTVSWESFSQSDYAQYPTITYTTNLKITIKQVRAGFVTYDGTSNLTFNFEWKYTADNVEHTNSTSVSVPLSLSDSKQSYEFSKKYEFQKKSPGSSFVIQSEIPFVKNAVNPTVKSVTASTTNMKATYYHCGVSGDPSLTYKSYEITIANYSYYLGHGSTTSGGYIKGKTKIQTETVTERNYLIYYLITNFRLEDGFPRQEFINLFGIDFLEKYGEKIKQFSLENYFVITSDTISLSDEGLLLMDFVLLKIL